MNFVGTPIGHVELFPVPPGVEPMRSNTRKDEYDLSEITSCDRKHPICQHVRHVKDLAIRGDADILRHAALRQFQITEDLAIDEIYLD